MAVLSTVAPVIVSLRNDLASSNPGMGVVYDPSLSSITSYGVHRMTKNDAQDARPVTLPLLAYNRSVIRPSQTGMGRMPFKTYETDELREKLEVDVFKVVHCEFDLRFVYSAKSMSDLEVFEIEYTARKGIHGAMDVKVDLAPIGLGEWPYYVHWNRALEDMNVEVNGTSYRAVGGSAVVYGWFVIMTGTAKVIKDIYFKLFDQHTQELMDELHITAD